MRLPGWSVPNPPEEGLGWGFMLGTVSLVFFVVPIVSGLILALTGPILGPLSEDLTAMPQGFLFILALSFYGSWTGLLLAIPVVVFLSKLGVLGWLAALVIGFLPAFVLSLPFVMPGVTAAFTFGGLGAIYGLATWGVIRLRRPEIFREPEGVEQVFR